MYLKVLPSRALRDAHTSPLVLVEDPQEPRVVLLEEAGVNREIKIEAAAGSQAHESRASRSNAIASAARVRV